MLTAVHSSDQAENDGPRRNQHKTPSRVEDGGVTTNIFKDIKAMALNNVGCKECQKLVCCKSLKSTH